MKQDNHRLAYFPKLSSPPAPKPAGGGGASLEATLNALPLPFSPNCSQPRPAHSFSYQSLHQNLSLLQGKARYQRKENDR